VTRRRARFRGRIDGAWRYHAQMHRSSFAGFACTLLVIGGIPGCSSVDVATGGAASTSSNTATATTTTSGMQTSTGTASSTSSTSTGASSSSGGSGLASCAIVPLYAYPSDGTTWSALAAAAAAHPSVEVVAIVNPDSGPGQAADPAFTDGIAALQAAKIRVVGYVPTNYGMKTVATVNGDTDDYVAFYPGIDGIFFDEMSADPAHVSKYSAFGSHAQAVTGGLTIGNPGTGVTAGLLTTMERVVVFENPGLPSAMELDAATSGFGRDKFAILPYEVPTLDPGFVASALAHVRCVYITDDAEPNPWDSLPPYFDALLGALEP